MIGLFRQLLAAILTVTLAMPLSAIVGDPGGMNGAVSYSYDAVGNRTQKTSTIPGYPGGLTNYNANDQLTTDTYDSDGNTTASNGVGYVYDFENHLVQAGAGISMVYDGDGNRASKTVAGVTTNYLVDPFSPTGYAQVVYETFSGSTAGNREQTHTFSYGLELVNEARSNLVNYQSANSMIYFDYDGHGSVRALTDPNGNVTDTYDYDAFGNLLHSTGTTPNNYLFAGEQFDPDLNLYYNRARYLNVSTGRFWTMDDFEGKSDDPPSLHKYLYAGANAINRRDPSGRFDIGEVLTSAYISVTLTISSYPTVFAAFQFVSAALTLGLFVADEDFRAVYVASGGNPAQALATEFSTLLDEAGAAIAKDVVQDAATTDLSIGAEFAKTDAVKPGERFVRVAASPEALNFSFKSPGGALARTYAFPEDVFQKIGQDPVALQDFGDIPGDPPVYYRVFSPPPGTPIQRGIVPGRQYGGRGGVPEVYFPKEF